MTHFNRAWLIALALLLAACASQDIPDPEPMATDPSMASAGSDSDSDTAGYDDRDLGDPVPFDDELGMIIYFEFDQSKLQPHYADLLARHANRLANDGSYSVRLEGHADERGSREYNIGLGERRSQAVRQMLLIQGATAGQISTVSFGEERPAAFGSTEEAWAQNRRVEIRYIN